MNVTVTKMLIRCNLALECQFVVQQRVPLLIKMHTSDVTLCMIWVNEKYLVFWVYKIPKRRQIALSFGHPKTRKPSAFGFVSPPLTGGLCPWLPTPLWGSAASQTPRIRPFFKILDPALPELFCPSWDSGCVHRFPGMCGRRWSEALTVLVFTPTLTYTLTSVRHLHTNSLRRTAVPKSKWTQLVTFRQSRIRRKNNSGRQICGARRWWNKLPDVTLLSPQRPKPYTNIHTKHQTESNKKNVSYAKLSIEIYQQNSRHAKCRWSYWPTNINVAVTSDKRCRTTIALPEIKL